MPIYHQLPITSAAHYNRIYSTYSYYPAAWLSYDGMVEHGHAELVCGAGCGPGVLGARPGRDHRQAGPIPLRHEHRGVRGPAPGLLYCTVLYCTVLQVQPQGEYNLAGVNLGGMRDTMALQNVFFRNPSFGVRRSNNQMFREVLKQQQQKYL